MTDQDKLQLLLDRAEIAEVVYNYATGVDSKDEKLFRSIWADEVTVDGVGGPFGDQSKPATLSADKWAAIIIKRISKFAVTQHTLTNPKIEVGGDQAKCVVYMQARHFLQGWKPGDPIYDMGGYYTHHLVRTGQGWRIKSYCLTVKWHINPPPQ
jgi:SnoaL-like domain